jgi:hypothetical protein
MNKLLKRFKVLHIGNRMILPLTEQGDSAEVYPGLALRTKSSILILRQSFM